MKYAIVTGSSRGIGAGLVKAMLEDGWMVFGISRRRGCLMKERERASGGAYRHHRFDLSRTMSVDGFIEKLVHSMDLASAEGVYLVNNAGILGPVGPAENTVALDSKRHVRVNQLAPIRAATGFLRAVEQFSGRRVIANISSGAAQRAYEGWSLYCSTKAAIEMWTRVVGAEQQKRKHPVHVFSIAPGVVDTDMQAAIRATSEEDFLHRKKFVRYHKKGLLTDAEEAGWKLLRSLDDERIENGMNVDVRELYR